MAAVTTYNTILKKKKKKKKIERKGTDDFVKARCNDKHWVPKQ